MLVKIYKFIYFKKGNAGKYMYVHIFRKRNRMLVIIYKFIYFKKGNAGKYMYVHIF